MSSNTPPSEDEKPWWKNSLSIYVAVVGVAVLSTGATFAYLDRGDAAATTLVFLGAAATILAPLFPRIQEFQLTLTGIKGSLRREVVKRVRKAPLEALEGMFPLLASEDVAVRVVTVPGRFNGKTLTQDLTYLRPNMLISVLALQEPNGRWSVGGVIADQPLRTGQRMLIAGPTEIIDRFAEIIWEGDAAFERAKAELMAQAELLKKQSERPT